MARKLKEIFDFKTTILQRALQENDVDEARRMLKKSDNFYVHVILNGHISKQSQEMAELFTSFSDKDMERWGFKENSRETFLRALFKVTLKAGRADLVDTYFNSGISFREGTPEEHEIAYVLRSPLDDGAKTALVKRFIESGIDKVENPRDFLFIAATTGPAAAFDLLKAELKLDIHKDNEDVLRRAAGARNKQMATHLVLKHGADLDLALSTERTLGHEENWRFLEEVRKELRPGEKAPHTLDSLAAEMHALKEELLALRTEVAALRGQKPAPSNSAPVP